MHYSIHKLQDIDPDGMRALRERFPEAAADMLNFVLFSTSGVHGTYTRIEEIEKGLAQGFEDEADTVLTVLLVQPRMVTLYYGTCEPKNQDDIEFLKELRASSMRAVTRIGM